MSAQLEDGYTRIANELLEQITKFKFNGTQLRIILTVWRFTYGFNRKDHEMSLSFFAKATQLGKTQLDRELTALIDSKVLIVTEEPSYTKPRKLGFNKNYDEWLIEYSQQKQVQSAKTLTVSELDTEQSANLRTQTVSKNADQEIHSFKDNLKNNTTADPFIFVLDAYCNLHNKLDYHVTERERIQIRQLIADGIPHEFIAEAMNKLFKHKSEKGEGISNFSYYPKPIRDGWKNLNGGEQDGRIEQGNGGSVVSIGTSLTDRFAIGL